MLAAAALLLAGALAQTPAAPALDARLLVGHPGLHGRDPDRLRDDWMRALAAAPRSPHAGIAARLLYELCAQESCTSALDPRSTEALLAASTDAEALHWLRQLHEEALDQTRFGAGRAADPRDPFAAYLSHFRLLGPCADAAEPDPLRRVEPWMPPLQFGPELRDEARGRTWIWQTLRRRHGRAEILPAERIPDSGTGFLACFLQAAEGPARLEIRTEEEFQAWWNGAPVLEELREGLADRATAFRAPIRVGRGWNALLVRCDLGADPRLALRLLDAQGGELAVREWQERGWPQDLAPAAPAPAVPPAAPAAPQSGAGWDRVLAAVEARLAGRPDAALALAPPTDADPELQTAWLIARWQALRANSHYPSDVTRARLIEIEMQLASDGLPPEIALESARRALREDRPTEALNAVETALDRWPASAPLLRQRVEVLLELDGQGVLARRALADARELLPRHAGLAVRQAELLERAGLQADARAAYAEALRRGAGSGAATSALGALRRGSAEERELARAWLDFARSERPEDVWIREQTIWDLQARGEVTWRIALLTELVQDAPLHPQRHRRLGLALLELGRVDEAAECFAASLRLRPSDHELRDILQRLGRPADGAEEFFAAFQPDVEAALRQPAGADEDGASTALLLDHGMVYVLPDGGYHYRTNTVQRAVDRTGTETMHEQDAGGRPRRARVLQPDGAVFEPHLVEDSWVFPELDPGDVLDLESDRTNSGTRGEPATFGSWRFASFAEPFALSRWVVYLPPGAVGEFRSFQFDGSHEQIPWQGGTVHVFERRDSARLKPEMMQPSEDEILPWAVFGADAGLERSARYLREELLWRLKPPADLALELDAFLAGLDLPAAPRARAAALYAAVGEHLLEFTGSGDVTDAWTLRRGDALILLSALLQRAGVAHEWAYAEEQAPELDPEPLQPFAGGGKFALAMLRLPPEAADGEPLWAFAPVRGIPFGALAGAQLGARALVLEAGGGFRVEELPRAGLDELWDLHLDVTYRIGEAESAEAAGSARITGAQGGALRQMVLDLEPAERDGVARQVLGQFVPGLNLAAFEFVGIERPGADFELSFQGAVPDFLRRSGDVLGARLRLPDLQLSNGFGPAERSRKLAMRASMRIRTAVRIETGPDRRIEYAPRSRTEERDGFRYRFDVALEERALSVDRVLEVRGFEMDPADFPAFLEVMRELEQQEKRAARIVPAGAEAPR